MVVGCCCGGEDGGADLSEVEGGVSFERGERGGGGSGEVKGRRGVVHRL